MTNQHRPALAASHAFQPAPRGYPRDGRPRLALDQPAMTTTRKRPPRKPRKPRSAGNRSRRRKPAGAKKTPEEVEVHEAVEVIGIRRSIETSIETKHESTSIVEAVSAEDIGKLPDVSIAESLARLPGLAAQRVDGRAQVIAIRGLSPDFAAHAAQRPRAGQHRRQPRRRVRPVPVGTDRSAVRLQDARCQLIGQGLSGTVDMRTVRPLSVSDAWWTLNLRGEYNSFGRQNRRHQGDGYRFSASYIDQFADNTVGMAIGFAHLDSPFQEQHFKAWWWGSSAGWFPSDGIPGKPAEAEMARAPNLGALAPTRCATA